MSSLSKILLSILLLLIIGGGGYLYMNGQLAQYAEYLPEPIQQFIPGGLNEPPPQTVVDNQNKSQAPASENVTGLTAEPTPALTTTATEIKNHVNNFSDTAEKTTAIVEQYEVKKIDTVHKDVTDNVIKAMSQPNASKSDAKETELMSRNILDSLNKELSTETDSDNADEIRAKIKMIENKISRVDAEKQELQKKFENIMKKNRELALKLRKIDKQLQQE